MESLISSKSREDWVSKSTWYLPFSTLAEKMHLWREDFRRVSSIQNPLAPLFGSIGPVFGWRLLFFVFLSSRRLFTAVRPQGKLLPVIWTKRQQEDNGGIRVPSFFCQVLFCASLLPKPTSRGWPLTHSKDTNNFISLPSQLPNRRFFRKRPCNHNGHQMYT